MTKKMPPREKIHEALSAIANNRVVMNDKMATVTSSDSSKKYIVEWQDDTYSSNDNATYWQGYIGYPIIAVLLLQHKINYDPTIAKYFSLINWKQVNKQFKNDYAKAVDYIYMELEEDRVNILELDKNISEIYDQLSTLPIKLKRSKHFPPK